MTLPIKKRLFSFDSTTTTNSTDKLVVEQGTEIKISTLDKVRIWLQGLFDLRYASISSFLNGTGFVKVNGTTVSYDNTTYAPFNTSYYIGTTLLNLNRSSASQTLSGVNIDGNAATVTNGFYNTSSFNLGTTNIPVNRASATQNLTGINIDGYSGTVSNTNLGATAIGISTFTTAAHYSQPAGYQTYLLHSSISMPPNCSGTNRMFGDWFAYNVIGKRDVNGGTYATLTSQNGSMWFTYMDTSSTLPTWTKIQTNVNTSATYTGSTSVNTSTSSGLITFSTVPSSGTGQTYTITNSYFGNATIAQAAIIDFSIKYLNPFDITYPPVLLLAGYFINSSGQITVRIYNAGVGTAPSSFQLCYNVIG